MLVDAQDVLGPTVSQLGDSPYVSESQASARARSRTLLSIYTLDQDKRLSVPRAGGRMQHSH